MLIRSEAWHTALSHTWSQWNRRRISRRPERDVRRPSSRTARDGRISAAHPQLWRYIYIYYTYICIILCSTHTHTRETENDRLAFICTPTQKRIYGLTRKKVHRPTIPSACIMAGIVLLLPLVFFRGGQLWRDYLWFYFFFIFAQDHGWGVEAIAADGGAGSTDMERGYIGSAEEYIHTYTYEVWGALCRKKDFQGVYRTLSRRQWRVGG